VQISQSALNRIAGREVDTAVLPALLSAMRAYAIESPARAAAFLAQVAHESGGFKYTREIWGPTPAQKRYEGRLDLGNTEPGDGERFKGRGYIQITGRSNYKSVGTALGIDLIAEPEKLELSRLAAVSAAWWWSARKLNVLADHDDAESFELITKRINGGLNGYEDRKRRWAIAKEELAAKPVEKPAPPESPVPPDQPAPIIDKSTYSPAAKAEAVAPVGLFSPVEEPMPAPIAAIAMAALPELLKRIPEFVSIFSDRSRASPEQYAEAASKASEVVMGATQTATVEAAIQKMDAEPQALASAREAAALSANELLGILLKANEADEKSRDAASARARQDKTDLGPWLAARQFWLASGFAGATALALVIGFFLKADKEIMLVLGTLFVNLAGAAQAKWGTIQDYRWGSSMGSAVKEELLSGKK
jgi:putative chitinase